MVPRSFAPLFMAAFTCSMATTLLPAQEAETWARAWLESSPTEKTIYLRGLVDGSAITRQRVLDIHKQPEFRRWYFLSAPSAPSAHISFDSLVKVMTSTFVDLAPGQWHPLVAIMDKLYADPANACLLWVGVAVAAQRTLTGRSKDDIDPYLEGLRKESSKTC